jgi:hypothetical protein
MVKTLGFLFPRAILMPKLVESWSQHQFVQCNPSQPSLLQFAVIGVMLGLVLFRSGRDFAAASLFAA